jgi:hypothetical protein
MTDTPASHLDDAVAEMARVARSGTSTTAAFEDAVRGVWDAAGRNPASAASQAVRAMLPLLSIVSPVRAGFVALCCGGLVERGADPEIMREVVVERLGAILPNAAAFATAALELAAAENAAAEAADNDPVALVDEYGNSVAQQQPRLAWAWTATDLFGRAAIAMLARSKIGRQAARQDGQFMGGLARLAPVQPLADWLGQLLAILDDEEILVLHPALGRGYQVSISGVVDNFQLHTLLAGALLGDPASGWLPGQPPAANVVAAARGEPLTGKNPTMHAVFSLVGWRGLNAAGQLSASATAAHQVAGEGTPSDIETFEGRRVILLGPPPALTWTADARFPGLVAELQVLEKMDTPSVQVWLGRLASAAQSQS